MHMTNKHDEIDKDISNIFQYLADDKIDDAHNIFIALNDKFMFELKTDKYDKTIKNLARIFLDKYNI